MLLTIDPSSDVPIYTQIVTQIKFAVADGTLAADQMLPSVRQLSKQITVNPNTVARAYSQLQSESIVRSLRGQGMVVCAGAQKTCHQQRQQILVDQIAAVLKRAVQAGLERPEIEKIVAEQWDQIDDRTDPA